MVGNPKYQGPIKSLLTAVKEEVAILGPEKKHWFCGGIRSIAIAVNLLREKQIIAAPTDTIYGLVGLAQDNDTVNKIYEIKKRDTAKPLAICVSSITDIKKWGLVENLPPKLLETLLPGPVTIVLKRTENLNPLLNPGTDKVGIRVPNDKFLRHVSKILDEPLALTSANESNKPSSLSAEEFANLWPQLGGIFYLQPNKKMTNEKKRVGSTVVDLSEPGKFKVIRSGIAAGYVIMTLKRSGLTQVE
ncbi:yrdC domain-containing protein, mitochondrial [Orussus abietinus]|uniref:yrdC domain-containing protein, mitochondrial n=1 Tax=Orussus abietinus TaxID=222816 RepID=UPI000625AE33|nr:yrdC domain-containing protein, mitochondrial [Orussus abietinus]